MSGLPEPAAPARAPWPTLLGPVFVYDFLRTARRGRYTALRCAYALLLLLTLVGVYASWFGLGPDMLTRPGTLPPGEVARFGAAFTNLFLGVQSVAILVLTPVCAAGAIAGEREGRTLDDLLTTDLTGREIVLGKLASRVAVVLLLVLTGLPFLSLLPLLGGTAPHAVAYSVGVQVLSVVSTAAVSVCASARSRRVPGAVGAALVSVLLLQYLTGPVAGLFFQRGWEPLQGMEFVLVLLTSGSVVGMLGQTQHVAHQPDDLPLLLVCQLVFHGTLTVLCVSGAAAALRREFPLRLPRRKELHLSEDEEKSTLPPLVDHAPMLWKELYARPGRSLRRASRGLLHAFGTTNIVILWAVLGVYLLAATTESEPAEPLLRLILLDVAVVVLAGGALRSAATIAGERQARTLESLRATPLGDKEILGAKWLGALWRSRWTLPVLAATLLAGVLTGGLHPLSALAVAAALLAQASFVVCVGMTVSLRSSTSRQAVLATVMTLLACFVGHFLLYLTAVLGLSLAGQTPPQGLTDFHVYGLTPPLTVMALAFPFEGADPPQLAAALGGTCLYALLAWVLWLRLRRRFRWVAV